MIVQLLNEFLNPATDVGYDIVVKSLERVFGTSIIKYKASRSYEIENYSLLKIKRDPVLLEELQKIVEIYNYGFRIYDRNYYDTNKLRNYYDTNKLEFSNENAILTFTIKDPIMYNISMLDSDSPFNNLYLHGGDAPPDIIYRTGLRLKDPNDSHRDKEFEEWQKVRSAFYLEFNIKEYRIYMRALNRQSKYKRKTLNTFNLEYLCPHEYGKYKYLIKLPPSYPVMLSVRNEDGPEDIQYISECYTTHSIPPQNILYIGYFDYHTMDKPMIVATREDVINFVNKKQV